MIALWLFVYTLAAFGLAYVVGHAEITDGIRNWLDERGPPIVQFFVALVECPACFGWWTGTVVAVYLALSGYPTEGVILAPFYTAATNFILGRVTGLIGRPPG